MVPLITPQGFFIQGKSKGKKDIDPAELKGFYNSRMEAFIV
jgi:hypothetical protein